MPSLNATMKDFSEDIDKAIDLLFKVSEDSSDKKQLLEKGKIVYLQVVLFRIPFGSPRSRKYLKLRHSLYGDDPEICLFVPNRQTGVKYKKTTDELIDFCIDYYTELLEKHKIKGIKTIMPLKQLMSEYGTYELRRKLVQRFDLFLCKNSLLYNPRFLSALGKIFCKARKEPLGVSFPNKDADFDPEFQKNIDRAIFTSHFTISRFSDNYTIPFGSLTNTKSELKENLQDVLNQILTKEIIPGGIKNIRAMHLWPSQSKTIPFFFNTELPVDMKTPSVKRKRKKRTRGVEGELSTQPNKKVFVTENGEVFVTKIGKKTSVAEVSSPSESEDSFVDDSEVDETDEETRKTSMLKEKLNENEEESESEDDEEIEEKEARLLKGKLLDEESFYSQSGKDDEEDEEEDEDEGEDDDDELEPEVRGGSKHSKAKQNPKNKLNGSKKSFKQKAKLNKNKPQKAEKSKKNFNKSKKKCKV